MPFKRALVTGAHGFVGRHLARHLSSDGWEVTGIGHGNWSEEEWQSWGLVRWLPGDVHVRALSSLPRVDAAFHCAGSSSVGFGADHPHEDFERNVATTAALLEWIRQSTQVSAVVFASSAAVYGDTGQDPAKEGRPPRPESVYGCHKLMAEDLCRQYARYFGLRIAIVRLFSVYGPGLQKQLLWDGCTKLKRGDLSFAGSGTEQRDWLHVEDVARLMSLAAAHASRGAPVVNGGTGHGTSTAAILSEVARTLDTPPPSFCGVRRTGDPERLVADVALAEEWGWRYSKQWRDGVREYCEWQRHLNP